MDRELITSEIIYWLYQVLTGIDSEFLGWPAAAALTTKRKQLGLGSGTLQDWVQELLKKVVFKVRARFLHVWLLDKLQHVRLCTDTYALKQSANSIVFVHAVKLPPFSPSLLSGHSV